MTNQAPEKKYPQVLADNPDGGTDTAYYTAHSQIAKGLKNLIENSDKGITIAIEGEWGSGKSTVVEKLKTKLDEFPDKYRMFIFDAWMNASDPLRWAFVSGLVKTLEKAGQDEEEKVGQDAKYKTWLIERPVANNKKRRPWIQYLEEAVQKKDIKEQHLEFSPVTKLIVAVVLIFSLYKIYTSIVHDGLTIFASFSVISLVGILILFLFSTHQLILKTSKIEDKTRNISVWRIYHDAPLLKLTRQNFRDKITSITKFAVGLLGMSGDDLSAAVLGKYKTYEISQGTQSGNPSVLEFQALFELAAENALNGNNEKERKLIIVIDNLDRVEPEVSEEVWSLVRSFVDNPDYGTWKDRIWVLVPIYPARLPNDEQSKYGEEPTAPTRTPNFFDKVFQTKVLVPRPTSDDNKAYLEIKLKDAFGEEAFRDGQSKILDTITEIFSKVGSSRDDFGSGAAVPRLIIRFVNDLVALYYVWKDNPLNEKSGYDLLPLFALYLMLSKRKNFSSQLADGSLRDPQYAKWLRPLLPEAPKQDAEEVAYLLGHVHLTETKDKSVEDQVGLLFNVSSAIVGLAEGVEWGKYVNQSAFNTALSSVLSEICKYDKADLLRLELIKAVGNNPWNGKEAVPSPEDQLKLIEVAIDPLHQQQALLNIVGLLGIKRENESILEKLITELEEIAVWILLASKDTLGVRLLSIMSIEKSHLILQRFFTVENMKSVKGLFQYIPERPSSNGSHISHIPYRLEGLLMDLINLHGIGPDAAKAIGGAVYLASTAGLCLGEGNYTLPLSDLIAPIEKLKDVATDGTYCSFVNGVASAAKIENQITTELTNDKSALLEILKKIFPEKSVQAKYTTT